MIINRVWAMPNSRTFLIKPIQALIERYNSAAFLSVAPFAGNCDIAALTNDIDPDSCALNHLDALDFLRQVKTQSVDLMFYDPPYSPRQISECYNKLGRTVNMQTTQASFWSNLKNEIARAVKPGGLVMSFGWNSSGIGKELGFEQVEILLVAHGGAHNDTICVVERKNIS